MSRVLAVGSYAVDEFFGVDRMPDLGESIAATSHSTHDGGKAANVAVAAVRVGADAALFAAVGRDVPGDSALDRIASEGVDTSGCDRVAEPTGRSHIMVTQSGQQWVVTWPGASELLRADVASRAMAAAPGDVVVLQGEIPVSTSRAVLEDLPAGVRTILNPSPVEPFLASDHDDWFDGLVDVLIVNETEAARLFPYAARHGDLVDTRAARQAVVATRGAAGALLFAHGSVSACTAPKVDVVDPTGAGDCLTGVLAAGLAAGRSLEESLSPAVLAASRSVTRRYCIPSYPSAAELGIDPLLPGRC